MYQNVLCDKIHAKPPAFCVFGGTFKNKAIFNAFFFLKRSLQIDAELNLWMNMCETDVEWK